MKLRARRGNAMLEFALASSILVPLFAGVFQFGYTLYVYNNLDSAVRGGARYASLRAYDSATASPSAAFSESGGEHGGLRQSRGDRRSGGAATLGCERRSGAEHESRRAGIGDSADYGLPGGRCVRHFPVQGQTKRDVPVLRDARAVRDSDAKRPSAY